MKIHYIAQYIVPEKDGTDYSFSPAGTSKMDYFLRCFKELNIETEIFSVCLKRENGYLGLRTIANQFGQRVRHIINIKLGGKFGNMLNVFLAKVQLFVYLITVPDSDIVYFYHERFYSGVFKLIKKIKNFRIICDVEELYTIHAKYSDSRIEEEKKYLRDFDLYTVASASLAQMLGIQKNSYALCCGAYAPCEFVRRNREKNVYNVLYAGTFDTTKGGARAAIEAFAYLDRDYHLTVCGFGTDAQIQEVKDLIELVKKQNPDASIEYRGYVPNTSKEYRDLLLGTDIGLATQNPNGDFNASSFPSKVFEYMRHGITVVSTAIEGSSELFDNDIIVFVEGYSAQGIANAIRKAAVMDIHQQNESLKNLHDEFKMKFKNFIG